MEFGRGIVGKAVVKEIEWNRIVLEIAEVMFPIFFLIKRGSYE